MWLQRGQWPDRDWEGVLQLDKVIGSDNHEVPQVAIFLLDWDSHKDARNSQKRTPPKGVGGVLFLRIFIALLKTNRKIATLKPNSHKKGISQRVRGVTQW